MRGQFGCHSFCLSVCLLPWHSSFSVHNFQGGFSRATILARPLAKVVIYCLVVFWKECTEQKATNIPKHEKTKQQILSTAIKTLFYKENKIWNKKYVWILLEMFLYKVMTHFVNLGLIFVDRLRKNTTHQHIATSRHMLTFISE